MPEEIEVDTDRLREEIDREVEAVGSKLLRRTALTTAILAALAAVASLRAGSTVNEALVLQNEATTLQRKGGHAADPEVLVGAPAILKSEIPACCNRVIGR